MRSVARRRCKETKAVPTEAKSCQPQNPSRFPNSRIEYALAEYPREVSTTTLQPQDRANLQRALHRVNFGKKSGQNSPRLVTTTKFSTNSGLIVASHAYERLARGRNILGTGSESAYFYRVGILTSPAAGTIKLWPLRQMPYRRLTKWPFGK